MDYWADKMSDLKKIVSHYGATPYVIFVEAMGDSNYLTRELPVPNESGRIQMNDAAYCLKHLSEIVRDFNQLR